MRLLDLLEGGAASLPLLLLVGLLLLLLLLPPLQISAVCSHSQPHLPAQAAFVGSSHDCGPQAGVDESLSLPVFRVAVLRDPLERCYSAYYYFSVRNQLADWNAAAGSLSHTRARARTHAHTYTHSH